MGGRVLLANGTAHLFSPRERLLFGLRQLVSLLNVGGNLRLVEGGNVLEDFRQRLANFATGFFDQRGEVSLLAVSLQQLGGSGDGILAGLDILVLEGGMIAGVDDQQAVHRVLVLLAQPLKFRRIDGSRGYGFGAEFSQFPVLGRN